MTKARNGSILGPYTRTLVREDSETVKRLYADVDDEMHLAVRLKAIREGKNVRQVIVELLQKWLEEDQTEEKREKDSRK